MKTLMGVLAMAVLVGAAWGADPKTPKTPVKPGAAPAAAAATKPAKELGGAMPLPVDKRIERQNSAADKLVVEITHTAKEGDEYVAYVKVLWGDLDNVIKKNNSQYYSKWDGQLKLVAGAKAKIDQKIQFEDKSAKEKPGAGGKPSGDAKAGTGQDEVDKNGGPQVDWKSGVVGAIDGLRIKITSAKPTVNGTLVAGKFTIPIAITPEKE